MLVAPLPPFQFADRLHKLRVAFSMNPRRNALFSPRAVHQLPVGGHHEGTSPRTPEPRRPPSSSLRPQTPLFLQNSPFLGTFLYALLPFFTEPSTISFSAQIFSRAPPEPPWLVDFENISSHMQTSALIYPLSSSLPHAPCPVAPGPSTHTPPLPVVPRELMVPTDGLLTFR